MVTSYFVVVTSLNFMATSDFVNFTSSFFGLYHTVSGSVIVTSCCITVTSYFVMVTYKPYKKYWHCWFTCFVSVWLACGPYYLLANTTIIHVINYLLIRILNKCLLYRNTSSRRQKRENKIRDSYAS